MLVGGVHTVLKTKAPITTREYGDRYTLVGRLDRQTVSGTRITYPKGSATNSSCVQAAGEFDELQRLTDEMAGTMDAMREGGVETFYGKWLVDDAPRVLLIDVKAADKFLDGWKREFEDKSGVELPSDDQKSEDALAFGYLAAWFFREVGKPLAAPVPRD